MSPLPKPLMVIASYKRCLMLINWTLPVDINHSPGQGQSLFQPTGNHPPSLSPWIQVKI